MARDEKTIKFTIIVFQAALDAVQSSKLTVHAYNSGNHAAYVKAIDEAAGALKRLIDVAENEKATQENG